MKPLSIALLSLFLSQALLPDIVSGQTETPRRPSRFQSFSLPFQARAVANGLEVTQTSGHDHKLHLGDVIERVKHPSSSSYGARVHSLAKLNAEIASMQDLQDYQGHIGLLVKCDGAESKWIFVEVAEKKSEGYVELPTSLGGISLLAGFAAEAASQGNHGEVWGVISGPDEMNIEYSIWPVAPANQPRTGGNFVSDAARLSPEQRQWFREQRIGDESVQIALSNDNQLIVSYPRRGINLSAAINGAQQLTDALLIMLSIPNSERSLPWPNAEKLIEFGDVRSVTQYHSGDVRIRMDGPLIYRTRQPSIDVVFDLLRKCGKADSVGMISQ